MHEHRCLVFLMVGGCILLFCCGFESCVPQLPSEPKRARTFFLLVAFGLALQPLRSALCWRMHEICISWRMLGRTLLFVCLGLRILVLGVEL